MNFTPVIREFKKNWIISLLGIVLLTVGALVLSANEREAFRHHSGLDEALAAAVSIKYDFSQRSQNAKSPNYEGKLIHVSGPLKVQEPIADAAYNILVQSIRLRKIVQMYQWHEDFTDNQFAEDDSAARNYFYYKEWNEKLVDSRSFHSLSHQNPRSMLMQTQIMVADRAFIGDFEIGDAAKEMFTGWIDVTSDTRPDDSYIKMHSGIYYHTEDVFDPMVRNIIFFMF